MPVDRPPGQNKAGIVAGVVTTPTERYPEGMTRVALFGDPTKALGSVAEPECAIVIAALDLAERDAGARSSGSRCPRAPRSPWTAAPRTWTGWPGRCAGSSVHPGGGEVNVVVAGINVGAQPYWNAEATMLMHTKGILVMTPDSAMVLTGKHSLDYSGGVSAEDNFGIGGYDRVMGPNGQAQYWAPNLAAAFDVLFAHYDHAYVAPGERCLAAPTTEDPLDRDVRDYPHDHPISDFTTVGDIFSEDANPERKKPFDIRTVMRAVVDQDHEVLERWAGMADADTTVVLDAHLGGYPVTVLGIESRPIPRRGGCPPTAPTSGPPARCSRCRRRRPPGRSTRPAATARWSCWRTCPASTARRSRCARCSSSTAPRSAGPSSTSTARSCSAWSRATTAARSWCSPAS